MILSRDELKELQAIAQARVARIDALKQAIIARDYRRAIELARAVCGMEASDEFDRSDPPLNSGTGQ
jgi:hypothetical protein